MRALSHGSRLFLAEVVLRTADRDPVHNQRRLLETIAAATMKIDADDLPHMKDVSSTSSYDMQPLVYALGR